MRISIRYPLRSSAVWGIVLAALSACSPSDIVDVDTPNVFTPDRLESPNGIGPLWAGAIGEWMVANSAVGSGNSEGVLQITALFSDEVPIGDPAASRQEIDARAVTPDNGTVLGVYRNIHRARRATEQAAAAVRRLSPTPATDVRHGELLAYAGYTYLWLAENFCAPQPISEFDAATGTEIYSSLVTREAIVGRAIAKFDSAVAALTPIGANAANLVHFATVGKARAQLGLGDAAAAATTVAGVPRGFRFTSTHSTTTTRQTNGFFPMNWNTRRYSIADREAAAPAETTGPIPGGVGLDFRGAGDPRVTSRRGTGASALSFDGALPFFFGGKYPTLVTPIVLADYLEAQLIIAEARQRAGDEAGYLDILNALRADLTLYPADPFATGASATNPAPVTTPLPPLAAPTPGQITTEDVDLLFRERAFWLWGTGHRLADLRRLLRAPYGRTEAATYPGGGNRPYFVERVSGGAIVRQNPTNGTYGNHVALPIPKAEENNPNFVACDPTRA